MNLQPVVWAGCDLIFYRWAACRADNGRTAAVDSQSVRAAETVGRARRGYDAGKKVAGTVSLVGQARRWGT